MLMKDTEYAQVCNHIIESTMQYINTDKMKRYTALAAPAGTEGPIYDSLVASPAPITLAYTNACTDTQKLISDRISAIIAQTSPEKIMILTNNIASRESLRKKTPVNVMTFDEFCHEIILANIPELELSDLNSIANTIDLFGDDDFSQKFSCVLRTKNPRDRMVALTAFVNRNICLVLERIKCIQKTDYALDAMLCQNMVYQFQKNPYNTDTILINNVQNMPVPVLCTVLEYAYRYSCNLFIAGDPDRTIYDFNMAYSGCMSVLSFYTDKQIRITRLLQTPAETAPAIKYMAEMEPNKIIDKNTVSIINVESERHTPMEKILSDIFSRGTYLERTLLEHTFPDKEKIIIAAPTKADIMHLRSVIETIYLPAYPDLKITDMTVSTKEETTYGTILAKNAKMLETKYPYGMPAGTLCYELYELLSRCIPDAEEKKDFGMLRRYAGDRDGILTLIQKHPEEFPDMNTTYGTMQIIYKMISAEQKDRNAYRTAVEMGATADTSGSDIILSTIHASSEMHFDHAVILLPNNSEKINRPLYRQALSLAKKSECIIFLNYGRFKTPYQEYADTHMA